MATFEPVPDLHTVVALYRGGLARGWGGGGGGEVHQGSKHTEQGVCSPLEAKSILHVSGLKVLMQRSFIKQHSSTV